ncbi:peptidoglycan editing factor PgeF [Endosaccharibacter trunci]|uniref:peptidoglycan editing factor PgeF n=1 Tax=Endosaccharibacter trunci TaxID=2812733 RepID=UPI003BF51887
MPDPSSLLDPLPLLDDVLRPCPHGFFTRLGGVSDGPFASLNCSVTSGDAPESLRENRRRVAHAVGVPPERLLGVTQVHGDAVISVAQPWAPGEGGRADAMVTDRPGLALGVITADCAPVLFADLARNVVGAAHAGWRGAVGGVLERTLDAMRGLGAEIGQVRAVIGPCIGQASYEVGPDLRDAVLAAGTPEAERFFRPGEGDRFFFDLAGYCVSRLRDAGVGSVHALWRDTLAEPDLFFSHRRRTLAGGGPIGHQISVIAPAPERTHP